LIIVVLKVEDSDIAGRHWRILGCSGMTGEGLKEGFDWIVDDIASRIFMLS
jgi:ADP-ribosylation factor-like protein 2